MKRAFAAVSACLCLVAAAAGQDKVAEIEQKLQALWDDVESCTGKMEMNMTTSQGGMQMAMETRANMMMRRNGEKLCYRQEISGKRKMGEAEMPVDMLIVCDGDTQYMQNTMMGQTMVMKKAADASDAPFGAKMLTSLKDTHDVKALDDADVDGDTCWVVEATTRDSEPGNPMHRQVLSIRQSDGVLVRMLGFSSAGEETVQARMFDFDKSASVPASLFEYTPPEGAQVMDMPAGDTP